MDTPERKATKSKCNKLRYARDKERIAEVNRKYRAENKGKVKESKHEYYLKTKEKTWELANKWKAENPERHKEYKTLWRKENPEKISAYTHKYNTTHREIRRDGSQRRRTKKLNGIYENINSLEIYERDEWTCKLCNKKVNPELIWPDYMSASIDHVVPIVYGGPHTKDNVQLAHLICNVRAGDKTRALQNDN